MTGNLRFAALALWVGAACTPTEPRSGTQGSTGAVAQRPDHTDLDDPVRIKGLFPRLLIHRQRAGRIERLHDGDRAAEGDLVQMSYVAAGNRYGVVVSLDGRGGVTLHYPEQPEAPPHLVLRGEHALDHAYELDDAQSYERFIFVTSSDPAMKTGVVLAAAHRLAQRGVSARHSALPLPERWQQSSVTLLKHP